MKKILEHLRAEWYKYLLEILVITVGILGAFALNNWNTIRQGQAQEKELMTTVYTELQADSIRLASVLNGIDLKANQANDIITFLIDPKSEIDTASLLANIYLVGRYLQFEAYLPTFDEIMSSGQSTLIQSRKFKVAIKSYLNILSRHESFLYNEGRENKALYNRHARKYFDYRMFATYWDEKRINPESIKFAKTNLLIDFEGFKSDPKSLYHARQIAGTDAELVAILTIIQNTFLTPTLRQVKKEIDRLK
jgi:hypothetical protein